MTDEIRELAKRLCMGAPCQPDPCRVLSADSCECVRAGNTIESLLAERDDYYTKYGNSVAYAGELEAENERLRVTLKSADKFVDDYRAENERLAAESLEMLATGTQRLADLEAAQERIEQLERAINMAITALDAREHPGEVKEDLIAAAEGE